MTHSVEHCGADRFDYEVVIQAQFLQVLVEVICRQTNEQFTFKIQRATLLYITVADHCLVSDANDFYS